MPKYTQFYKNLKAFTVPNDPEGLIDMGFPHDEYDDYYSSIISFALKAKNKQELMAYLAKMFSGFGGLNKENCEKVCDFIWERIDEMT